MDLLQRAQSRLEGMEFPALQREPTLPGSSERTAPIDRPIPLSESIEAGLSKSWLFQVPRALSEPDAYYSPDDEDLTKYPELLEGIPEDRHNEILGQTSKAAAEAFADDIREKLETERIQFANGAFVGLASEIASYLDPVSVASGNAAVNGIMKVPKLLRLGKMAKRAAGATSIGGVVAAEETLRAADTPSVDEDDVLYATAAGMAVGGVLGPFIARSGDDVDQIAKHATERTKEVGKAIQDDLDEALVTHPERDRQTMNVPDERYEVVGEGIEVTDDLKARNNKKALTENFTESEHQLAARADELVANGEVSDIEELGKIKALLKKNPIISDGVRAALSKSPVAKVIASHIGEIATGTRGKVATSAAMHKNQLERVILQELNPVLRNSQVEYLSRRGIKQRNVWKFNGSGKRQFDRDLMLELARRHSNKPLTSQLDDAIKKAADAVDTATKRGLDELQRAGWKGADEVQWRSGYFPLIWSGEAISKMKSAGKLPDVQKALDIAYQSVGMSPELSTRLSRAVINRSLANAADIEFNPATLFSQATRGELERMLVEAGVKDLDRTGIMKLVEKEASGIPKRTDIDLTTEFNGVRVMDLVQGDIPNMLSRWTQRTAGQVGLAKKGVNSFDMVDSMKKLARTQAAAAGEDPVKLGHSVDAIFDGALANPIFGGVSRNVRRVMDWSLVTKLGQIGFPQIAEMNNISAAHGLFQSIKSIPQANKLYKQLKGAAKSGNFENIDKAYMGEIQVLGGQLIDEHLLYRPSVHLDEVVDTGWMGVVDNVSAVAVDALGTASGMYRVKGIEQTLTTMLQAEKVVRAMKGTLNKKGIGRLRELGWGDETISGIKKQVDTHATFDKGVLDRLNLDQWDATARSEFLQGLHRHVHQTIQFPMTGESTYWMHKDVAALMLQFRSFPMLAVEKQTGRHLIAGDQQAAAAFMYGLAWSSVASLAKTYTNSIGRSDRKNYLKKRLEPEALFMQSMNYASSFSLMGDLIGSAAGTVGMPISGYYGGFAPALSGAGRAYKGVSNVIGSANPLSETELTERGVRNAVSAIPLSNTVPFTLMTNELTKRLD